MTHMATAERVLDLRALSAAAALAEALSRFDALSPGERFVLIAAPGTVQILQRFQAERRGLFEWSPLELGPSVWRTAIARRTAPAGARRGILEALAWDHDRLDALEEGAFHARASGDLQSAFDLYEEFAVGLRRHIGFEEDLLFPAFESATGMPSTAGPTAVMRSEHREIRVLLERIAAGMGDAGASVEAPRSDLQALLARHNLKEEQVLYPAADNALGAEHADQILQQVQGYGVEAGPD